MFVDSLSHTDKPFEQFELTKNDYKIIEQIISQKDEACCVIIEPIQYNNNVNVPNQVFLKRLREVCDEHNITLIFDEVQTYGGWLGYMTASQLYEVKPDILCISKALTAGYGPLAMVIADPKYQESNTIGSRTNGSDVRSLTAAKAVIERMLGVNATVQFCLAQ